MSSYAFDVADLLEDAEKKADAPNDRRLSHDSLPDRARGGGARNQENERQHVNTDRYDRGRTNEHRDSPRRSKEDGDGEAHDSSDKGSANGSVRTRRRSRSPKADDEARRTARLQRFGSGSTPRDPGSYRDRGETYRPGDRRGSREQVDSYRPHGQREGPGNRPNTRDDDRRRPRDRDGERGGRDSYRERNGRDTRDRRRSPEPRRERQKTPEPTDDERDKRTVFVQQLAARLRTKELMAFFEQIGPVKDAQIVKDRVSGRSKG